MSYRLLVVRDDPGRDRLMSDLLQSRGYTIDTASNCDFSVDTGFAETFDLIVIDALEPPTIALEICSELRRRKVRRPILMLAARNHIRERVAALKAGADDCLTKPVDLDELELRIEALLRRSARSEEPEISSYEFGGMRVNFRKCEIIRKRSRVELSERESRLLQYFVENRGKTISRMTLLQQVWNYRRAPFTRTVDVHILRLRHKIERDPKNPRFITTVHGLGYRFDG